MKKRVVVKSIGKNNYSQQVKSAIKRSQKLLSGLEHGRQKCLDTYENY